MIKRNSLNPEIIQSNKTTSMEISRLVKAGAARKLGHSLYTLRMDEAPESVVLRNAWHILALLTPNTIVTHRSAFESRVAPDGSIFVTGSYPRQLKLPGLTIRQLEGPGPIDGDRPFMGVLYFASVARYLLENLAPSRQRETIAKTVGRDAVEERLTRILASGGVDGLNKIRDEARGIAPELGLDKQSLILDGIIGALMRTRPSDLTTPTARAYAAGEPFDASRQPLFNILFSALNSGIWTARPDNNASAQAFVNTSFYDAYFSNYIEGTEFSVDEAVDIVFNGVVPFNRPADAHDIRGTFELASDRKGMSLRPNSFDDFIKILKQRHATIMEGREETLPGQFKVKNNYAGTTMFVPWDMVIGTLRQGYALYEGLSDPFARALFMMFLVSEVHPFMDGNGRVARIMMNAELIAEQQVRIIIPTVYRDEYVNSLKRLSNNENADAYIKVMARAQLFVSKIDFGDFRSVTDMLTEHNAFENGRDDVKLKIPDECTEEMRDRQRTEFVA